MHLRMSNAEIKFKYDDGELERLEIIPPFNFWPLCPWGGVDYNYETDSFSLSEQSPMLVLLGNNCRANILGWNLQKGKTLVSITIETISP